MTTPVELNAVPRPATEPTKRTPVPAERYCWLNGDYAPESRATIPIDDPAFLLGEGLFETLRVRDGAALFVAKHWTRLERTARAFDFPLPKPLNGGSFAAVCRWLPRENGIAEGKIRFTISPMTALATIEPWTLPPPAERKPLRLLVSPARIHSAWTAAGGKSTSRAGWSMAREWAIRRGFDDALLLNERDEATESSRSNIFFATRGGAIVAPPLGSGLLPGVARETLIEAIRRENPTDVEERPATLDELPNFAGAFLTNVARGVEPIAGIALDDGREAPFDPRCEGVSRAAALWERLAAAEAARARTHWSDLETRG